MGGPDRSTDLCKSEVDYHLLDMKGSAIGHGERTLQGARGAGATNSGPATRRTAADSSVTPEPMGPPQNKKGRSKRGQGAAEAGSGVGIDRRTPEQIADDARAVEAMLRQRDRLDQRIVSAGGSPGLAKTAFVATLPLAENGGTDQIVGTAGSGSRTVEHCLHRARHADFRTVVAHKSVDAI